MPTTEHVYGPDNPLNGLPMCTTCSFNRLTCNACQAAPMAIGQEQPGEMGYCIDCLEETMKVDEDQYSLHYAEYEETPLDEDFYK